MKLFNQSISHHELYLENGTILFVYDSAIACTPKGSNFCYVNKKYAKYSPNMTRYLNIYCPKGIERILLDDEQMKLKLKEIMANG